MDDGRRTITIALAYRPSPIVPAPYTTIRLLTWEMPFSSAKYIYFAYLLPDYITSAK